MLQSVDQLLLPEVKATIAALDAIPADAAVIRLAEKYATTIDNHKDQAWAMRWIGPLLLDCLESLGATALARSKLKDSSSPPGTTKLDRLRAVRR